MDYISLIGMSLVAWDSFAEREHIALMLVLPILSLVACRIENKVISVLRSIIFGLMAGVAVCIKPHFAAAILIPQAYVALRRKSFSAFWPRESGRDLCRHDLRSSVHHIF